MRHYAEDEPDADVVRLLPYATAAPRPRRNDATSILVPFEQMRPYFEASYAKRAQQNHNLPPTSVEEPLLQSAWICLCKARSSRTSMWRSIFRKWVSDIGGGYSHIELALIATDGSGNAWTVDFHDPTKENSGVVRLYPLDRQNSYPSEYWDVVQISTLTPAELIGINTYCYRQAGKPMNSRGLYSNMPLLRAFIGEAKVEEDRYFCSQLIVAALKWIRPETFANINPRKCTPAQLRDILQSNDDLFPSGDIFRPLAHNSSSY